MTFLVYATHLLFRKNSVYLKVKYPLYHLVTYTSGVCIFYSFQRVLCITPWFPHHAPTLPQEALPDLPTWLCYIRTPFPGGTATWKPFHALVYQCLLPRPHASSLRTGASHGLCTAHPQPWEQGRGMEALSHDALSTEWINQNMTSALKIFMVTIPFSVYVAPVHFITLLEPFNHTEAGKAGLTLTSVRRNQLKTEGTLWTTGRRWVRWQSGHLSSITLSCCPDHGRQE